MYTLPLLTISMTKGTGIVTCVPSDAPTDFAALRDLKEKPKLREKYHITDEMVLPYDVVEIIEVPGMGKRLAEQACLDMGIKSQNDTQKLEEAKELVYKKGFYEGVMLVGSQAGKRVSGRVFASRVGGGGEADRAAGDDRRGQRLPVLRAERPGDQPLGRRVRGDVQ